MIELSDSEHRELVAVLERSRELGHLGPGPVEAQISHASGFARAVSPPSGLIIDLGSGGGLPGLFLSLLWKDSDFLLLDANRRRTDFLSEAAADLRISDRVSVLCARAEDAGRDKSLRGSASMVVARSFGPPPVLAECAAPLLKVGGLLVVSEPPPEEPVTSVAPVSVFRSDRWPVQELSSLGLEPVQAIAGDFTFQLLRQFEDCPERFPRRVGIPTKRPLYKC